MKKIIKALAIVIIAFILFSIYNFVYARYVLTRQQNITIKSSPFCFAVQTEKDSIVMARTGADLNISINNYDSNSQYNTYQTTYEISIEGNSKFTFTADGETPTNNVITRTIDGGSQITQDIAISFIPISETLLNPDESVNLKIKTTSPYTKELIFPININTNSSTLSGIELNFLLKNGSYAPEGDVYEYYSVDANRMVDNTVKKIVFGKYDSYKTAVAGITAEAIDVNRVGVINLYRKLNSDGQTYTIYILSEDGTFELGENAAWTFDKLYSLESIENLHLVNTSKVTNMRDMFCDCASLTNVDLSNFSTSKVTDMTGMFARMYAIEFLDLITFDTSSVKKFNQMFSMSTTQESQLKTIYVSDKWVISDNLENDSSMFSSCVNLVGGNGTVYDSTITNSTRAVIDGTSAGYLTGVYNFAEGVYVNNSIKGKTAAEMESWTTSSRFMDTTTTSITFGKTRDYYKAVKGYTGTPVDAQKSGAIQSYRIPNGDGTYSVYILSNSGTFIANSDSSWMFDKFYVLNKFNNFNLLDTSKVTNMRDMFCDCETLAEIDLSNFDTSNVTSMQGMFARMYSIKTLDLSSFDTSKVTVMLNMFVLSISATETLESFQNATPALTTIYVSDKWTTSKAADEGVFANNVNLIGGNGTKFSTSNVNTSYARIDTASTPGYLTKK